MMLHSLITQFVQWCSEPLSHQIFPWPLLHFCLRLSTRPPSQRWPLCWKGSEKTVLLPLLVSGYSVECREPIHKAGVRTQGLGLCGKRGKEQYIHLQLHMVVLGKVPFPIKHSGLCFYMKHGVYLVLFHVLLTLQAMHSGRVQFFSYLSESYQLVA